MKLSGLMLPVASRCRRSSPTAPAARSASRDVALLEVALLVDGVAPDARVAVGLQLEAHRELVRILTLVLLEPPHLIARAELLLHVVPDLVRDHVRPGEVAPRVELVLEVPVEAEIEIHDLIAGAVEGTDRRAGGAAGRAHAVAVQDHACVLIWLTRALEGLLPGLLRIGEHVGAEVLEVALGILGRRDRRRLSRRGATAAKPGVDVEGGAAAAAEQLDGEEQDHADNPEAATHGASSADRHSHPAGARAAPIDHVRIPDSPPLHPWPLPKEASPLAPVPPNGLGSADEDSRAVSPPCPARSRSGRAARAGHRARQEEAQATRSRRRRTARL